jgi:hypothetical protein
MLTIRSDQIQSFDNVADEMFVDRVSQYLREQHADTAIQLQEATFTVQELNDETLHDMVRQGVARARAYDITHESTLAAFVVLQFETAPNFDDHPSLRRVLKDDRVEPNLRIDRLLERATPENWEAVKARYDAGAWLGASQGLVDGQLTLSKSAQIDGGMTLTDEERFDGGKALADEKGFDGGKVFADEERFDGGMTLADQEPFDGGATLAEAKPFDGQATLKDVFQPTRKLNKADIPQGDTDAERERDTEPQ